jgi:hypothetical protein
VIRKRGGCLQVQVFAGRDPLTGRKRWLSRQVRRLHTKAVRLSGGTPYFHGLASSVPLTLLEVVDAPGVTHLRFAVARVTGHGRT